MFNLAKRNRENGNKKLSFFDPRAPKLSYDLIWVEESNKYCYRIYIGIGPLNCQNLVRPVNNTKQLQEVYKSKLLQ